MKLSKIQTGQICRARPCRPTRVKISKNGPLTQNLLCIYCISIVGWHDLPPKTYRRARTLQLDFSLTHSLDLRDPQRDESGLATSQCADTIAFY